MNMSFINAAMKPLSKVGFALKKNAPEIMVATGIVSGIAGAVAACKATTKAQDILSESQEKVDQVHQVLDDPKNTEERYSQEDSKKDLAIIYFQTGLKLAKAYAPAIGLGILSIASILGGHKILRGRNVALAAAYATIDQTFKDYRGRVVERFGQEVDRELRYNLKAEKITETEVDPETGKQKRVKKTVYKPQGEAGGYSRMFDAGCNGWSNDAIMNRSFLEMQQLYANQKLEKQGYLFLSEVYKMLGFREDKASHCVGWVYDPENPVGDNFVSFGFDRDGAFMDGYEKNVLLDFNVDGPILDRFEAADMSLAVC